MEATRPSKLSVEELQEGRLRRVVLDAGKGNVLDRTAIGELRAAVAAPRPAALRAVLLDHAGPDFSFGASVADHAPDAVGAMLPELHALARELLALDVPVLCAVRGRCLGGGLELALLADLVFAAPGALFGQPETKLGVFAPIGSLLLPRAVGPRRAADLLLSGRTIDAAAAHAAGLVAEVDADPTAAARAWFDEHLAPKSAAALRFATRAARRTWLPAFAAELAELERLYLDELMATRDAREGIAAFLEKRAARWEDR